MSRVDFSCAAQRMRYTLLMNNAHTVILVNGSEKVTFEMTETSSKVSYRNSRGEFGSMSRRSASTEIDSLIAQGWRPGR